MNFASNLPEQPTNSTESKFKETLPEQPTCYENSLILSIQNTKQFIKSFMYLTKKLFML